MIKNDLVAGKTGEIRVKELFERFGYVLNFVDKENRKFYDLISISPNFSIEVKNDLYTARSGNIAIEYFNCKSNTASGITSTKSTLWAHIFLDKVHIVTTSNLKKFIEKEIPLKICKKAGDKNADLLIFQIEQILPIFVGEDLLTKAIIEEMLREQN